MKNILVIGATGQIGMELVPTLRKSYGDAHVVAAIHRKMPSRDFLDAGPYEKLDVRDGDALLAIVEKYRIDTIYHLAALLSRVAEDRPRFAWDLNMNSLLTVLQVAGDKGCSVFFPSSIGAFGPSTPKENTPQLTIMRPNTMYGVTKVAGELLCDYFHQRFGIDTRGVRYPGIISHKTPPSGGTTDYAVEIFFGALREKHYTCPLKPDTRLDMMYIEDAILAAIEIMEADPERLVFRNSYNITAMSFSPAELAAEIRVHIPDFVIKHEINPMLQAIADSWPDQMDDRAARDHWGWQPQYDLGRMTGEMLLKLADRLKENP
ncbi:MAG: NAD-dependent epimerase/dehydratase family protein [Desulfobulbales bacterium]